MRRLALFLALALILAPATIAQAPASATAPAPSNAERSAIGYIRTLVNAQKVYKTKRGSYAPTLAALVGSGSFTKRMASTDRGEYRVAYRATQNGYTVTLAPLTFDAEHRSFFADQSGKVRVEAEKVATAQSEPLK